MQLAITEKYLEDVCPIVRVILQDFQYAVLIWQLVRVFYYNLVKFHSNHKNIFLERKKWKEKGVYVLLFSLSTISVVSTISASCIIVLLYVLFLYVNHRRYFKTYWSGKLQPKENFLLYWYNWVRRNPCHCLLSWIV